MCILTGFISFLFYYIYDLNQVFFKTRPGSLCFIAGSILLAFSTAGLVFSAFSASVLTGKMLIASAASVLFLVLLIYTLFFALPAKETYVDTLSADRSDSEKKPCVCNTGMYALCRHPGVLWLFAFYLCLYLAVPGTDTLLAWILFSTMDLLYIVLQDLVIFPRQFADYDIYKQTVPFLIPNRNSICAALKSSGKDQ